jgi:hypothetical protein
MELRQTKDTCIAFEQVYAVWDYHDGPRSGIAAYLGQPHHYQCEWDKLADDLQTCSFSLQSREIGDLAELGARFSPAVKYCRQHIPRYPVSTRGLRS